MKNCPKCGALAVLFADYEKNDLSALGLRCLDRCGCMRTMADVEAENVKLKSEIKDVFKGLKEILSPMSLCLTGGVEWNSLKIQLNNVLCRINTE